MNAARSQAPFAFWELSLLFNCWFCAIALFFPTGNPYFAGPAPPEPALLAALTVANSVVLTAVIYWLLTRRGRLFSPLNVHFVVPVSLYAIAVVASLGLLASHG